MADNDTTKKDVSKAAEGDAEKVSTSGFSVSEVHDAAYQAQKDADVAQAEATALFTEFYAPLTAAEDKQQVAYALQAKATGLAATASNVQDPEGMKAHADAVEQQEAEVAERNEANVEKAAENKDIPATA